MRFARNLGRRLRAGAASRSPRVAPGTEAPVNGYEILEKVASLPISTWRYEWEPPDVRHLGPMAQDFKATFGLGDKDTVIPIVDTCGVSMVAIQALCRRVAELEERVAVLSGAHEARG